jgi:KTSC domain
VQIELDRNPNSIIHSTPFAHWCAGCWDWVIDCVHLIDPLPSQIHSVSDPWIRGFAYDARRGILQIAFTWHEVRQYRPVASTDFRHLLISRPMQNFLNKRILNNRRIRTARVRTEQTLAFVMAMAAEMVLTSPC